MPVLDQDDGLDDNGDDDDNDDDDDGDDDDGDDERCGNLFLFSGFLKAELGSCSLSSPPCKAQIGADADDGDDGGGEHGGGGGGGGGGEHRHHHLHKTVLNICT